MISLAIGALLSASALYLALRHVPVAELWTYLISIDYLWALPSLGLVLASLAVRAIRWRYILAPTYSVSITDAFHPLMIGFMINCILPGRLGEIARPVALKQTRGIAFGTGLATVAAERFFDLLWAVLLFVFMLNVIQIDPELTIGFGEYHLNRSLLESLFKKTMILGVIMLCGLLLVGMAPTRHLFAEIIAAPSRISSKIAPRLSILIERFFSKPLLGFLDSVAGGLKLLHSPQRIVVCMILTIVVWTIELLSYVVLARGCPGLDLTVLEMGAYMIIILFFIALPSVPGWWGLWEAGGVFALSLFGVPPMEAAGFTLVGHALHVLPTIIIGLGSVLITGIGIRQFARAETKTTPANGGT